MATSNNEPVSQRDLEQMEKRLAELSDMIEAQRNGTSYLEKADQAQLVAVIRDATKPMPQRNRATEILLAKVGNDPVKFTELVKG